MVQYIKLIAIVDKINDLFWSPELKIVLQYLQNVWQPLRENSRSILYQIFNNF